MDGTPFAIMVLAVAFLAGSVPFSNLVARRARRVDLRSVGGGTVSGTAVYRVAGFGPLAVAGVLDVAKGSVGVLLAGRGDHPLLAALAGGAAVAGHNWSPFLRGAGGRGISPALGAFFAWQWIGAVVLAAGLVFGRLARQTGAGSFVADVTLVPVLATARGTAGAWAAAAVLLPMIVKRLAGNVAPTRPGVRTYLRRLVFDNDGPGPSGPSERATQSKPGDGTGEPPG